MSIAKLTQSLAKSGPQPVYILQGTERLLVDEAARAILKAAVGDPDDTMAVTRVDLAEGKTGARDVVAACRAMGLFASRIAVLVRAAEVLDKKTTERDEVARYLDAPLPTCTLILKATKLDGKSAVVKRAKKHGEVYTFDVLREREAIGWARDHAASLGNPIDPDAVRLVVELAGTDLLALANTVAQLSLYVGQRQPITSDAVEALLTATRSHSVFELMDAVGERRSAAALRHLGAMLGHREPPLRIMAMLTRHVRFLWQIGELRARRATLDDAQAALKLHPYQAKKMWAQSMKFDAATLRHAYERLYQTDLALKSTRHDPGFLMERLVIELCS